MDAAAATDRSGAIWTGLTTRALLLGGAHACVDAASGFLVFRDVATAGLSRPAVVGLVVLYNVLAFGGQAPLGHLGDGLRGHRAMALAGVALAAAGLLAGPFWTLPAVVVVGLGNALFHVGAGAEVLRASGARATEPGVFVGPGAVGLFAGVWLGGSGLDARWAIVALLALSAPLVRAALRGRGPEPGPLPEVRVGASALAAIAATLLAGSVVVRSLVGGEVTGAWRGVSLPVLAGLAAAAAGGKMLGGFVSDRVGWLTTSVLALALSAPLVSLCVGSPLCAIAGMLLFQMTMPVTLKAVHQLMPSRPGLAFGIPCAALLVGALPGLLGRGLAGSWPVALLAVALSAALVALGLRLLVRAGAPAGRGPELAARLGAR